LIPKASGKKIVVLFCNLLKSVDQEQTNNKVSDNERSALDLVIKGFLKGFLASTVRT
jgi:hypothetical protein